MNALFAIMRNEMIIGYGMLAFFTCLCFGYALLYFYKHKNEIGWQELILWCLYGGVFVCLVVPMATRLAFTQVWVQYLTQTRRLTEYLIFIPPMIVLTLFWLAGARILARKNLSHLLFLLLFFLPVFFLFRFLFLYFFDAKPYSDFETYWLMAQENVQAGSFLVKERLGVSQFWLPYCRRVAVIWTPLIWFFGAAPAVYKSANVVMQLMAFLMAYRIAVRHFGKTAAQLALWLILFVPELIFSCNIPSHDLNGMFLLLGYFFLLDEAYALWGKKKKIPAVVLALFCGILWLAVDLQRSHGPFIFLCSISFVGLHLAFHLPDLRKRELWKTTLLRYLSLFLLIFLLPWGSKTVSEYYVTEATGLRGNAATGGQKHYHTSIDNWNGMFQSLTTTKNYFASLQKSADPPQSNLFWSEYYRDVFLSGYLHNHVRYIPQLMNRASGLLWLGKDVVYYFSRLKPESPIAPHYSLTRGFYFLSDCFMLVFLLLGIFGVTSALKNRDWKINSVQPLLFLSALVILLLFFGEIQARYTYPIWIILPLYLGVPMKRWLRREKKACPQKSHLLWGTTITTGGFFAFFMSTMAVYALAGNPLLSMQNWEVQASERFTQEELYAPFMQSDGTVQIKFENNWNMTPGLAYTANNLRLQLRFPAQPVPGMYTKAAKSFSLKPDTSYIFQGVLECASQEKLKSLDVDTFYVTVSCNGSTLFVIDYKKIFGIRFVRIPGITADENGKAKIEFRISAKKSCAENDWKTLSSLSFSHFQLVPAEAI